MEELDAQLQDLMWQVRERTLKMMAAADYQVATKTSYNDLVTDVDKSNERFIVERLKQLAPDARILGEEGFGDSFNDLAGRVFIVDPIDGTLNFVKQHEDFAIMLACYEDGEPTLGYIMDVMAGRLYHGGRGRGVWVNDDRLNSPANRGLRDSLVDVNFGLIQSGKHNFAQLAQSASSLRLFGSAGIAIVHVLNGQTGMYLSYLKPWDLAAGRVLAEELGLVVKSIDGTKLDVLSSNLVLVATKQVATDVLALVN